MFCFSILRKKGKGLKGTGLTKKSCVQKYGMGAFGLQKVQVQFSLFSGAIPVNHFHKKQVQHGDFHQASKSNFYLQIQECRVFFFFHYTR